MPWGMCNAVRGEREFVGIRGGRFAGLCDIYPNGTNGMDRMIPPMIGHSRTIPQITTPATARPRREEFRATAPNANPAAAIVRCLYGIKLESTTITLKMPKTREARARFPLILLLLRVCRVIAGLPSLLIGSERSSCERMWTEKHDRPCGERGYVNRCVNDIRRRPSQPLIQWRFHTHTVHRDRRLRSTQGPSDA